MLFKNVLFTVFIRAQAMLIQVQIVARKTIASRSSGSFMMALLFSTLSRASSSSHSVSQLLWDFFFTLGSIKNGLKLCIQMEVVTLLSTHCGFDFLTPQPIQEQRLWKAIWRMTRSTLSFWNRGRRNSEWGCRMKGWATHHLSGLKCAYFCYRFFIDEWY